MNNLWDSIGADFKQLAQSVSQILANNDAEFHIRHALEQDGVPCRQKTLQNFRRQATFPKNVVRFALAADCLSFMKDAIFADLEIETMELLTAYSLVRPLSKVLGKLKRYRPYSDLSDLEIDDVESFLMAFHDDANWFGGCASAKTYILGMKLCRSASLLAGDISIYSTYESMVNTIIAGVFDGGPMTTAERKYSETIGVTLLALRPDLNRESKRKTTRTTKNSSTAGHGFAVEDGAELRNELNSCLSQNRRNGGQPEDPITSETSLEQAMTELDSLIGLEGVKAEVKRLTSFLKVQQQRRQHGLRESNQTLHFVFSKRPPQALLTGFLFWAGLHYPASTKGTNYVRCQRACSAC